MVACFKITHLGSPKCEHSVSQSILQFSEVEKFWLGVKICLSQTLFFFILCTCLSQRHRSLVGLLLSRSGEGWRRHFHFRLRSTIHKRPSTNFRQQTSVDIWSPYEWAKNKVLRVLSCYLINYTLIWLYWVKVSRWTIILVTRIEHRSIVETFSTPSALIVERKWCSVFCWICFSSPVWRQQGGKINCTSRHSPVWVNSTIIPESDRYFTCNRFYANYVDYASLSSFCWSRFVI